MATLSVLIGLAGGCADVFDIERVKLEDAGPVDAAPSVSLVQQITAGRGFGNTSLPITYSFTVAPTALGHTLVFTSVINTSSWDITQIVDNGGNSWSHVVTGERPNGVSTLDCHHEVWRAPGTGSATMVTITISNDREFAGTFTEWSTGGTVTGSVISPYAETTNQSTGPLTVSNASLLVASIGYAGSTTPPTIANAEYATIGSAGSSAIAVATWYQVAGKGTHEVSWTLPSALPTVASLVAIAIE